MQPGKANQQQQQQQQIQQQQILANQQQQQQVLIQQQILRQQQNLRQQQSSRQRASRKARASSSPEVSPGRAAEARVAHPQHVFVLEQARPPSSRLWSLNSDRLTIGRDPSSDVFVDDSGVSRHHADLVRHGQDWSIIDAGSTNGTSVNGASVGEMTLRPGDRIEVGDIELILRHAGADSPDSRGDAVRYDVGAQVGNISNVAGDQANYYQESNLRFIASRRGRARRLIVSGIWLFFIGAGLAFFDVFSFDNNIFNSMNSIISHPMNPNSASSNLPPIPPYFMPLFALGILLGLLGIALFISGLIARGGAKQEARNLGVDWS